MATPDTTAAPDTGATTVPEGTIIYKKMTKAELHAAGLAEDPVFDYAITKLLPLFEAKVQEPDSGGKLVKYVKGDLFDLIAADLDLGTKGYNLGAFKNTLYTTLKNNRNQQPKKKRRQGASSVQQNSQRAVVAVTDEEKAEMGALADEKKAKRAAGPTAEDLAVSLPGECRDDLHKALKAYIGHDWNQLGNAAFFLRGAYTNANGEHHRRPRRGHPPFLSSDEERHASDMGQESPEGRAEGAQHPVSIVIEGQFKVDLDAATDQQVREYCRISWRSRTGAAAQVTLRLVLAAPEGANLVPPSPAAGSQRPRRPLCRPPAPEGDVVPPPPPAGPLAPEEMCATAPSRRSTRTWRRYHAATRSAVWKARPAPQQEGERERKGKGKGKRKNSEGGEGAQGGNDKNDEPAPPKPTKRRRVVPDMPDAPPPSPRRLRDVRKQSLKLRQD
ncbi:hypothetical protein K438DRAFT_1786693 [Mycena galopus ATCC 62051]|nr:hypothetical protein K438DRAFT_1786693 [Mycena galopus ATCC 62051]